MRNPVRGNDYGTVGDSLTVTLDAIPGFRTAWLDAGATAIDATQSVDDVGHALLTEAAMAVLRLRH